MRMVAWGGLTAGRGRERAGRCREGRCLPRQVGEGGDGRAEAVDHALLQVPAHALVDALEERVHLGG